jgi:hypothetical protein
MRELAKEHAEREALERDVAAVRAALGLVISRKHTER